MILDLRKYNLLEGDFKLSSKLDSVEPGVDIKETSDLVKEVELRAWRRSKGYGLDKD